MAPAGKAGLRIDHIPVVLRALGKDAGIRGVANASGPICSPVVVISVFEGAGDLLVPVESIRHMVFERNVAVLEV